MSDPKPSEPRRRVPTNTGLLELVRAKREWHWKPSPDEAREGFRGWHQRVYIPHFDAPNVTQMVTFMLADSFPVQRRAEWQSIFNEPVTSKRRGQLEEWLDRGYGECCLRNAGVADIVQSTLLRKRSESYRLRAWCVMPNHVHVVVDVVDVPLSRLIKEWKGASARPANQALRRSGSFWQKDYFDSLVRDDEHFHKAVRYVERNPVKAKLVQEPRNWKWSSATIRDKYQRLPWEIVAKTPQDLPP